ncbi:MAG: type 2 isopentenyl-diphosphate Delta-isomerase [Candidatus Diapherotrites archaeon]|nr:type 2 isopentenyl-diphosphate Delta-isomerase [Candidatus Diapherotrites archaeon]
MALKKKEIQTVSRKREHIDISLKHDVQFKKKTTGFEDVELEYLALPELDFKEIDTSTKFLGFNFSFPLFASSITGGHADVKKINEEIAKACSNAGIGMALGSIRAMLEDKKVADSYKVRKFLPKGFLAGNLGVSQLKDYSAQQIGKALDELQADALFIHLNAAQEALQKDGTPNFKNCIKQLYDFCEAFEKPVILKEVGNGISGTTAEMLKDVEFEALDVAGAGGTSWTAIDSLRGNKEIAETFWDFGTPTAVSLIQARMVFDSTPIIASGGIRSGLDVAKAITLGADLAGTAMPVLHAQHKGGVKGIEELFSKMQKEFRIGMFLTGAKKPEELKGRKYYLFGKTAEWVEQ